MPWKETSALGERTKFVAEWKEGVYSMAELCRAYGVSRPTGYKWVERYQNEGWEGLASASRAPVHHWNETPEAIRGAIVAMRQRYPHWGAPKIKEKLAQEEAKVRWPAESTIGAILRREGLTVPRRRRRRTPPYGGTLVGSEHPNGLWCADFKGWFQTRDGQRCDPLTISDARSRYLLRCHLVRDTGTEAVRSQFEATFREYGLPEAIRTDNGAPFASRGIGGLSRLSVWWIRLGIRPERIEPGEPQQNGQHERIHRTMKAEGTQRPEATPQRQQAVLDGFRQRYNEERPHEALQMRCPAQVYERSGREYPARLAPVEYPSGRAVRQVQQHGQFYWHGEAVFVGEALVHEPIGLEPLDDRRWKVYYSTVLLGVFNEAEHSIVPVDGLRLPAGPASGLPAPFRGAEGDMEY